MIENRLKWADCLLAEIAQREHFSSNTRFRAREVRKVLGHGGDKHRTKPHRGVDADIQHALEHLKLGTALDDESGQSHRAHAAANLLLAFGSLMELINEEERH